MTSDDEHDDLDSGSIIATILTEMPDTSQGEMVTYGVGADNTAMIGIVDDDELPVASISSTHIAVEGFANDADGLVVTLTPASGRTVQVAYAFADGTGLTGAVNGTDYIGTNGTLTFVPDSMTGLTPTEMFVPFSIRADSVDDPAEMFTITLSTVADGNASVNDSAKTAMVTIDESPTPELSIASSATTTGVTEGLSFQFTITSDIAIPGIAGTDKLTLDISVDDSGTSTGAVIVEALEIDAGESSATFTVSMDSTFDTDSSTPVNITVTLNSTDDYDLSSTDPITVEVKDNDAPTAANPLIKIARVADYIVEGGNATFTLTSTGTGGATVLPSTNKDVNVQFSVNNEDFIAASETSLMKTETITSTGDAFVTISLETKADDPDGDDYGEVTATLMDGENYVLSSTDSERTASVVVLDKLPEISIAAIDPVDEATGQFTVTLESDIELVTGLPINITSLTVDDANSVAPQYDPQITTSPIQIPSANGNDSVEVTVTFTAVSGYVGWDDLTVSLAEVANDLYTVDTNANSQSVTIRPEELSTRTVSIDAPASVVEDENITLTLTASEALGTGESIMVELNVTEASGTFLDPSFDHSMKYEIDENSMVDSTANSVSVTIPTREQTSTANGSINIAVVRGPNYEPDTTNGTKIVAVQEKDLLPKVTIALPADAPSLYDEGEIVTFEISASAVNPLPANPITVYVMLADDDTGDFLADATVVNAHPVTVSSGSSEALEIMTVADAVDEDTGGLKSLLLFSQTQIKLFEQKERPIYRMQPMISQSWHQSPITMMRLYQV